MNRMDESHWEKKLKYHIWKRKQLYIYSKPTTLYQVPESYTCIERSIEEIHFLQIVQVLNWYLPKNTYYLESYFYISCLYSKNRSKTNISKVYKIRHVLNKSALETKLYYSVAFFNLLLSLSKNIMNGNLCIKYKWA